MRNRFGYQRNHFAAIATDHGNEPADSLDTLLKITVRF